MMLAAAGASAAAGVLHHPRTPSLARRHSRGGAGVGGGVGFIEGVAHLAAQRGVLSHNLLSV